MPNANLHNWYMKHNKCKIQRTDHFELKNKCILTTQHNTKYDAQLKGANNCNHINIHVLEQEINGAKLQTELTLTELKC